MPVPKQSGPKSEYKVNQWRSGALLWVTKFTGGLQQIQIVYICCQFRSVSNNSMTKNEKDENHEKYLNFEIRMDSKVSDVWKIVDYSM